MATDALSFLRLNQLQRLHRNGFDLCDKAKRSFGRVPLASKAACFEGPIFLNQLHTLLSFSERFNGEDEPSRCAQSLHPLEIDPLRFQILLGKLLQINQRLWNKPSGDFQFQSQEEILSLMTSLLNHKIA